MECGGTSSSFHKLRIQGDPNQKLQLQIAVTLKVCIFDPILVKPKCVSGVANFFNCQLLVYNFQLFVYNVKKIRHSSNHFWSLQNGVKNA